MSEFWRPFPKQEFALSISPDTAFEVLYGGSRGGGKTEMAIQWLHGDQIGTFSNGKPKYYIHHPQYRALVLRESYSDLVDWIDRANRLYKYAGVEIVGNPAEVRWPSGAKFRLGHLKDKSSYQKYLGHEYHRLLIEELTLIPQEKYYIQILGSVRSTVPELKTQVFSTTNPGNAGHLWVYNRFVKPAPYGTPFKGEDGRSRIYIPATIDDNPVLMKDKGYLQYLDGIKHSDPNLYKAWRHGDWSVFEGQFFGEFDPYIHVVERFVPNDSLTLVGGADWGYSPRPFVLLLGAVQKVRWQGQSFNRLWVYDEIRYTKKTPQELAQIIKDREPRYQKIEMLKLDPSSFTKGKDGSMSIGDQFVSDNINFTPANNDRPNGWMAVRRWLSMAPDGLPYMLIGENCNFLIKNMPTLVYDDLKKNDLNTDGLDDECFCRHTKILTSRGNIPIIDVCIGDKVWTPLGWSRVLEKKKTGIKKLVDFQGTGVTLNHPFLTQDGFRQLKHLQPTDRLLSVSTFLELPIGDIPVLYNLTIANILSVVKRNLQAKQVGCTKIYGNTIMVRLKKVFSYITKIRIITTSLLKICVYTLLPIIIKNTSKHIHILVKKILKLLESMQLSGTKVRMLSRFIDGFLKSLGKTGRGVLRCVISVRKNTKHTFLKYQDFVVSTVKCQCSGEEETYNLATDTGMYIANNVLVSNCDGLRYMCVHVPWIDAGKTATRGGEARRVDRYSDIKNDIGSLLEGSVEDNTRVII